LQTINFFNDYLSIKINELEKNRLEAFSDGVFAIVITLMILEIKVPHVELSNLNQALVHTIPEFLSFGLSFIIIGVYWVSHHNMLHFISKVDRNALWLNIFTLLTICIIPFPTALLGDYPNTITPVIFYGSTLAAVNFTGAMFWIYCTWNGKLSVPNLNPEFARRIAKLHLSPLIMYVAAILFSFVSVWISYLIYIIVPLFFIIPNSLLKKLFKDVYV
jgi:uncharacterized membrane protein